MELTMSMFADSAEYWKVRAEMAEMTVKETAEALGCEPDNEAMLAAADCVKRYRWLLARLEAYDCDGPALVVSWPAGSAFAFDSPDVSIDAAMAATPAVVVMPNV